MTQSSRKNPPPDVVEQAAFWAALLDSGDISSDEQKEYEAWCAMHPLHQRTLERMRAFDNRVTDTDDFERDALRKVLKRRRHIRAIGTLLGIAIVAFTGWATMHSHYVQNFFPDYQTETGETRIVILKDGSEITINPGGAMNVHINGDRREIELIRGQILAKVASNHKLPFIVRTKDGSATALGTSFIVRREESHTQVVVIESHVRICPDTAVRPDACHILAAGEQAGITPNMIIKAPVGGGEANEWLEADDREVADILAELNQYRKRPIHFDAAALRGITVTGSFPLYDAGRALQGMANATDITVRHDKNGEIRVEPRR